MAKQRASAQQTPPDAPKTSEVERTSPAWKWTNNANIGTLLGGLILAAAGFVYHSAEGLSGRIGALEIDVAKLKQRVADGGTHEIVSALRGSNDPSQITAQLQLLSSEIKVARLSGKPPDQHKIDALVPAVQRVAATSPETLGLWTTVSAFASYRTSAIEFPSRSMETQLPDCDSGGAQKTIIHAADVGADQENWNPVEAYLFQNCRLYLDRLPLGKALKVNVKPSGNPSDIFHGQGGPIVIGQLAYVVNAQVIYRGTISETEIIKLITINCRFDFESTETPSRRGQQLLLAGLSSPEIGSAVLPIAQGSAGAE